jgi:4-hydroxy-2-oxoheptanedioate aldolase
MVFIGPNDLALSILGHTPARQDDSEFHQAVDTVVAAAQKFGVRVGTLVSTGEQAKEAAKRFDLIAIGGDVKAITWWFEAQLSHVR